jgi:glucokinase
MSSHSSLLVDIGGTNMRYAYANRKNMTDEKILLNISDENITSTLNDLLSNPQIKNTVIAAAGPRLGNKIKMTNRGVIIDGNFLGKKFKLSNSQVLNDWEAVGYAVDEMTLKQIKRGKSESNVDLMIGPGTGLGFAIVSDGKVIPTEIGNTKLHSDLLLKNLGIKPSKSFAVLEDVISGPAISRAYQSRYKKKLSPEEIVLLAKKRNPKAKFIIYGFLDNLIQFMQDVSIAYLPRRILLGGSLITDLAYLLKDNKFLGHYTKHPKAQHTDILNSVEINLITSKTPALKGCFNYLYKTK